MKHTIEAVINLICDIPVATVIAWHFFVAALPTIVLTVTLLYTLTQWAFVLWKWKREKDK
jgi:hypothetical protein